MLLIIFRKMHYTLKKCHYKILKEMKFKILKNQKNKIDKIHLLASSLH